MNHELSNIFLFLCDSFLLGFVSIELKTWIDTNSNKPLAHMNMMNDKQVIYQVLKSSTGHYAVVLDSNT